MLLPLLMAGLLAGAPPALEQARDRQDRAALEKIVAEYSDAAAKAPKDAEAQYRAALAASYLAAVQIEMHERKPARAVAERGIEAADRAIALKPDNADYYAVLGTLCGQAVTDLMSGLRYGPRAKEAVEKAVEKAPKSSNVYLARGVGNLYLPAQLGGGPKVAIPDLRKAIQIDAKNAEAYLWLGIALRDEHNNAEARQMIERALALNPNRVWAKQQLDKTPAQ
ncbi:MAG TPA: tetratricopeptide repeat protein [Bryobacteraceae bacterium]